MKKRYDSLRHSVITIQPILLLLGVFFIIGSSESKSISENMQKEAFLQDALIIAYTPDKNESITDNPKASPKTSTKLTTTATEKPQPTLVKTNVDQITKEARVKKAKAVIPVLLTILFTEPVIEGQQKVTPSKTKIHANAGDTIKFALNYQAGNPQLPSLGVSLYFNNQELGFLSFSDCLKTDKIANDQEANIDEKDTDKNSKTSHFVSAAWASTSGEWPGKNVTQPLLLCSVSFKIKEGFTGETQISLQGEASEGEEFLGTDINVFVP